MQKHEKPARPNVNWKKYLYEGHEYYLQSCPKCHPVNDYQPGKDKFNDVFWVCAACGSIKQI